MGQVELLKLNKDIADNAILEAYRRVYSTDDGKIVIAHLFESYKVHESIYDPDPITLGHNSGMQDAGLFLLSMIEAALEPEENLPREVEDGGGS